VGPCVSVCVFVGGCHKPRLNMLVATPHRVTAWLAYLRSWYVILETAIEDIFLHSFKEPFSVEHIYGLWHHVYVCNIIYISEINVDDGDTEDYRNVVDKTTWVHYPKKEPTSVKYEVSRPHWSSGNVLAIGPKVRGFKPSRGRWILMVIKISSMTYFGGEAKSHVVRFKTC
jgi:hypothetical protein